ncbi:MAG: class II glutamine amidotransferase [Deltaproteobacteria bacterium]|nr:class II glutamine amidotransferase [Deltaproteobacteria bacterium]
MGRIAAYLGPRVKIASVVEGGSYALLRQTGDLPDGFGIGWYPGDGEPEPVRLLSSRAVVGDDPFLSIPRRYSAECVLAIQEAHNGPRRGGLQPLQSGPFLFLHDGQLDRYSEVYQRPLRERLSPARYAAVTSNDPSELLFQTFLDALGEQQSPEAIANALESMVATVQSIGAAANAGASFAVVVSNGQCLVTLRTATFGPPPALYTIVAGDEAPLPATGRVVATEPLFPGQWSSLDPHSLVIFTVEPS